MNYAASVAMRLGIGGEIGDRQRIEEHQVGGKAWRYQPPISEPQSPGGQVSHLVNGGGKGEELFLPYIPSQNPWKGAVGTGMGRFRSVFRGIQAVTVGTDRNQRVSQD